jgi:hypothetical protein
MSKPSKTKRSDSESVKQDPKKIKNDASSLAAASKVKEFCKVLVREIFLTSTVTLIRFVVVLKDIMLNVTFHLHGFLEFHGH